MMVKFTVAGKPQGKGRPRHGANGNMYTPVETREYEAQIRTAYLCATRAATRMHEGPLLVVIEADYDPPMSLSVKRRLEYRERHRPKVTRPDLDNIIKAAQDALNGVAWHDDAQVAGIVAVKSYGGHDALTITIKEFDIGNDR